MIQSIIRRLVNALGYEVSKLDTSFGDSELSIIRTVRPFTMTSPERLAGLIDAVNYVEENRLPGDIVECGVWRGGSMMAAAKTLLARDSRHRTLHLFDTFEGMTPPTHRDKVYSGENASEILARTRREEGPGIWAFASYGDVRQNLNSTGYPMEKVFLHQGKVEDTLVKSAPDQISILRLDTDWYESTKHELVELYPRLVPQGVLIIDDYGHWQGARQAVDEYFEAHKPRPFFARMDYTGRLAIKPTQ